MERSSPTYGTCDDCGAVGPIAAAFDETCGDWHALCVDCGDAVALGHVLAALALGVTLTGPVLAPSMRADLDRWN